MIILKHIHLEVLQLLRAKRTSMVSIHRLLNTVPAIYMTTPSYIAVCDRVQTDCALEFMLEFLGLDAKTIVV